MVNYGFELGKMDIFFSEFALNYGGSYGLKAVRMCLNCELS